MALPMGTPRTLQSPLIFLLLLALPVIPARSQIPAPSGKPFQSAGQEPGDSRFLDRLRRQSGIYRRAVLSFTCNESLLEESVQAGPGTLRSRRETTYRYLLQANPDQPVVSEYREILARNNVPVRISPAVVKALMPPPFLWATLFDDHRASHFRFEVLGHERRGVTDTVIIAFQGLLDFDEGRRLPEWTGRIWIDQDRLNPVHLEAEPSNQEERLKIGIEKYQRAFRLGTVPLRPHPRAYLLTVEFLVSRYGLSFPSQSTWRKQTVMESGDRLTEQMVRRRFTNYRFFNIQMDEIVRGQNESASASGREP